MGDSILFPPTLSSSSINITHGALALASSVRKNSKGAILLTAEQKHYGQYKTMFFFKRLTEKVSDATCADSHKHFIKL